MDGFPFVCSGPWDLIAVQNGAILYDVLFFAGLPYKAPERRETWMNGASGRVPKAAEGKGITDC
jgi:hypothetical protein